MSKPFKERDNRWHVVAASCIAVGGIVWLLAAAWVLGWHHLRWDTVSQIAVALSTLILALMTLAMVSAARSESDASHTLVTQNAALVKAEQEQVDISTRASKAAIRPWLAPLFGNSDGDAQVAREQNRDLAIEFKLKNVGSGLALIRPSSVQFVRPGGEVVNHPKLDAWTSTAIVPVGETVSLRFFLMHVVELAPPLNDFNYWLSIPVGGHREGGHFELRVTYSDADGQQETEARINFEKHPSSIWDEPGARFCVRNAIYVSADPNIADWHGAFDPPWNKVP